MKLHQKAAGLVNKRVVTLPGLPRRPNQKAGHWSVAAREAKDWRTRAYLSVHNGAITLPVRVTLTRVRTRGPEADTDGLVASCKHIRDGICDALFWWCLEHVPGPCGHIHDSDPRLEFVYAQRRGPQACVEIEIAQNKDNPR